LRFGTLQRIAEDPGYEPRRVEIRMALGMKPVCSECHRPVRMPAEGHERKEIPIVDEPVRRVLSGAWKLPGGRWGSPEDLFGMAVITNR
jgi:hypothetical protein